MLKYIILIFLYMFCTEHILGQDITYDLDNIGDTYVVLINIKEKLYTNNCPCSASKDKCSLFSAQIKKILFVPQHSVFSENDLIQMSRVLIADSITLNSEVDYIATLKPGTGRKYIVLNRLLESRVSKNVSFRHTNGYLSGFIVCYRIGIINKVLLRLGVKSVENINYSRRKKKKDPFYSFLEN